MQSQWRCLRLLKREVRCDRHCHNGYFTGNRKYFLEGSSRRCHLFEFIYFFFILFFTFRFVSFRLQIWIAQFDWRTTLIFINSLFSLMLILIDTVRRFISIDIHLTLRSIRLRDPHDTRSLSSRSNSKYCPFRTAVTSITREKGRRWSAAHLTDIYSNIFHPIFFFFFFFTYLTFF